MTLSGNISAARHRPPFLKHPCAAARGGPGLWRRAAVLAGVLGISAVLAGAETNGPAPDNRSPATGPGDIPAEALQPAYLFEVCRYIYRWQLDESDIESLPAEGNLIFWVRALHPALDAGDKSRLAEIILPGLSMTLRVKKADYFIPELNTMVKSPSFKITNVARGALPAQAPADCRVVSLDRQSLLDFLYHTRNQRDYPDEALGKRLRAALRDDLESSGDQEEPLPLMNGRHIVHLAPLSPVANELWAYWENGRRLLKFSSDIDLANPAVWDHEELMVHVYDIDRQVVVSLDEAPGSNRFLTRDQVGRALYNCIVLGQRVELAPDKDEQPSVAGSQTPAVRPPPADPKAPLGAGAL